MSTSSCTSMSSSLPKQNIVCKECGCQGTTDECAYCGGRFCNHCLERHWWQCFNPDASKDEEAVAAQPPDAQQQLAAEALKGNSDEWPASDVDQALVPCDLCKMLLNGDRQYQVHIKGKRHRKKAHKRCS